MDRCTSRTSKVAESQFARVNNMTMQGYHLRGFSVPNQVVMQAQLGFLRVTNTNTPFPSTRITLSYSSLVSSSSLGG